MALNCRMCLKPLRLVAALFLFPTQTQEIDLKGVKGHKKRHV